MNAITGIHIHWLREIVLNALDLRRRVAREVMRPRSEISLLDTRASLEACLELAEKTRYSRFPLCEGGDVDRTLGVVHIKDLFALRTKARSGAELATVARKLIFVPPSARLERVLELFLDRKLHMALVVDEYGVVQGMMTPPELDPANPAKVKAAQAINDRIYPVASVFYAQP